MCGAPKQAHRDQLSGYYLIRRLVLLESANLFHNRLEKVDCILLKKLFPIVMDIQGL